jgi:hypothetical protein
MRPIRHLEHRAGPLLQLPLPFVRVVVVAIPLGQRRHDDHLPSGEDLVQPWRGGYAGGEDETSYERVRGVGACGGAFRVSGWVKIE